MKTSRYRGWSPDIRFVGTALLGVHEFPPPALKRGFRAAVGHACECPLGFRAEVTMIATAFCLVVSVIGLYQLLQPRSIYAQRGRQLTVRIGFAHRLVLLNASCTRPEVQAAAAAAWSRLS